MVEPVKLQDKIKLNIGGKIFNVSRKILTDKSQYFNTLLECKNDSGKEITDIKLDDDPRIFKIIWNYINNNGGCMKQLYNRSIKSLDDVQKILSLVNKYIICQHIVTKIISHCNISVGSIFNHDGEKLIDIYHKCGNDIILDPIKIYCINMLLANISEPYISNKSVFAKINFRDIVDMVNVKEKSENKYVNISNEGVSGDFFEFRNLVILTSKWSNYKEEMKDNQIDEINVFFDNFINNIIDVAHLDSQDLDDLIKDSADCLSKPTLKKLLSKTLKMLKVKEAESYLRFKSGYREVDVVEDTVRK